MDNQSLSHICCNFKELQVNIEKIKSKLEQSEQTDKFITLIKPCYLQEYTSILLP